MKLFFSITLLFSILLSAFKQQVHAQNSSDLHQKRADSVLQNFGKESFFVIKGSVKNFKAKYFEIGLTSFTDDETYSVIVKDDGSFEQKIPVIYAQQLHLYLNDDLLPLSVRAKDTLTVNWDEKDFKQSFKISGHSAIRNAQLQMDLNLYKNFTEAFTSLLRDLAKNKNIYTAEQKFKLINDQFNEKIRAIIPAENSYPELVQNGFPLFNDLILKEYFTYAELLRQYNLLPLSLTIKEDASFKLPKREFTPPDGKKQSVGTYSILSSKAGHMIASEPYLMTVPAYRKFLYNYIRLGRQAMTEFTIVRYSLNDALPKPNFILKGYYHAKATFSSSLIYDWFTSNLIKDAFTNEDFSNVEHVYQLFKEECRTPYFRNFIEKTYAHNKNIKPGLPAPNFTLKDINGKNVSLADYKGKVVYIDFWGVGCGPCIYEFENTTAKLQAKYKEQDIVYMYICVDSNEKEWKEGIKKYKLDGINLIAEGWEKNPVCQTYNVQGIPRYVLINKDGTIANQSAPRPSELLRDRSQNDIEIALKKL